MSGWLLSLYLLGAGSGVLDHEDYRFCHEPRYPLYEDERRWCDLGGEPNPRCPDLPKACQAKVEPGEDDRFSGEWQDGGNGPEDRAAPDDGDDRKAKREPSSFELPSVLSPIAQVLLLALFLAGVVLLVRHILNSKHDDPDDEPEPSEAGPSPEVPQIAVLRAARETDVSRLLNLARAEAASARFEQAVELAYAAALRRLDGDGLIELHHSRTNGDYVRRLHLGEPQLAGELRSVVREVEGMQFGARAATRERFDAVLGGVMRIVGRGATALLLVLTLGWLPGCGEGTDPEGEPPPGPVMGGDTSPTGERAVLEAIAEEHPKVSYRIEPLETLDDDVGTVIVLPGSGPSDGNWEPVLAWVKEGGRLILAGARPAHDDLELFEDPRVAPRPQLFSGYFVGFDDMDGWTLKVPPSGGILPQVGLTEGEPVLYRYLSGDYSNDEVSVYAVGVYLGDGEVIAFANDDLFTNIAMSVEDNARAMALMAKPFNRDKSVHLCTTWTGSGSSSPFDAVRNADLTAPVVQLLIFLALLLLYRGIAFGRLRDPERHGRRAFVDHVRALASHYSRANATGHAWQAYAAWALDQIDLRLPGQRRRGLQATASAIAARTNWPEIEVITLLVAASDAANRSGPASMRGPASTAISDGDGSASLHDLQRMAAMLEAMGPSHVGTKPKK